MPVKPSEYFTGDNRLVYTQYGPMSQRYAMKSIYNNVAPASGFQYVEDEKYNDILNKYDPSGLGFDWTGKAKGAKEYVQNYFSGAGLNWNPAGDNALASGVNYGSGANTAGIYHTMPTKPVAWGDIANQVSYDPTATGKVQNPVTGLNFGALGAGVQVPTDFDVTKGSQDPLINRTVYGEDYFPANQDPAFAAYMISQGWQGAVPRNAQEFASLTPEQQGQYRTLLQRNFASKNTNIGTGSQDPAVNALLYGSNYFPGASDPTFSTWMASQGWVGPVPTTKEQFSALTPAQQARYRELLAAKNKGVSGTLAQPPAAAAPPATPPETGGNADVPTTPGSGAGGSLGAGAGTGGATFKDYGQLGSYGFQFPLVEQFDPTQIDKIPSVKWLLDNVDAETRNALLAQGRLSGDFGINSLSNAKMNVLSDQLNQAYNRYIQDQGNARAWGTFGQGEDQRQFQNMFNLAQMGQQSASQAASIYDSWGKNSAALFDEQGTYIGEAGNAYAKNAASTVQNYVTTQIGLDQQHAGQLINLLGNYGMNLSDIMMWMADPTTAQTLAALKAQTQAGTGQNIAVLMSQLLPSIIEYAKKQQK